jgi:methyl-accepting chemotaxis protein
MKMTVGIKIAAAFSLCVLTLVAASVVSYGGIARLLESAGRVADTHEVLQNLENVLVALMEAQSEARSYLIAGDQKYVDTSDAGQKTALQALKRERVLTSDNPAQQRRLDILESLIDARFALMRKLNEVRQKRGEAAAAQEWSAAKPDALTDRVLKQINGVRDAEFELRRLHTEQIKADANRLRTTILVSTSVVAALTGLAGFLLHRSISLPLAAFCRLITKVGEGDLTQISTLARSDEFGELSQSLNLMVSGLKNLAGQTRTIAANLNSSAAQILASAKQQSASASEQAAAVQQANVTMQELSQSGIQISERAKLVSTDAKATSKAAAAGIDAVQNTNRTMQSIRDQAEAVAGNAVTLSERTQAVGEIVASVTEIAEQAHLLSLNAAIEAAAAGEHGRTFSVVAGEIKNLADRSKSATIQVRSILSEIQKGINRSVMLSEEAAKRVETGKEQADLSARTIRDLTGEVDHSVQAFDQIVAGTNQQRIGFDQVTVAIRQIGQASEQAASSIHELEGAATQLTARGHQLLTTVERYRI